MINSINTFSAGSFPNDISNTSSAKKQMSLTPLQQARKSSLHSHAVAVHNHEIKEIDQLPTRQELIDHANEWYFGNYKLALSCEEMIKKLDDELIPKAKEVAKRQRTGLLSVVGGGTLEPFDITGLVPLKDAVFTFYHDFEPRIASYLESMQIVDSHVPSDNFLSRWIEPDKDDAHEKALMRAVNGIDIGFDVDKGKIHLHPHKQLTRGLRGIVDNLEKQYHMAVTLLAKANGQTFDFDQLPTLVNNTAQAAQDYVTKLSTTAVTWGIKGNAVANEELNREAHQAQVSLLVQLEQIQELLQSAGVPNPTSHVASFISLLERQASKLHDAMGVQANIEAITERGGSYDGDDSISVQATEINELISEVGGEIRDLYAVANVSMPMAEAEEEVDAAHKTKVGKDKGKVKAVKIAETYKPADDSVALLKKLKSKLKAIVKELENYREGGKDGGAVGRLSHTARHFRVRQGDRFSREDREVTIHMTFNKPRGEGIEKQQAFY